MGASTKMTIVAAALLAALQCCGAFVAPSPLSSGAAASTSLSSTRPPLAEDFYQENWLDKVSLDLFRSLVQREIGFKSQKPGFDGLVDEAQNYMVVQGATPEEQQDMVIRCLKVGQCFQQQGACLYDFGGCCTETNPVF
jgi:hypothetical protein